MLSELIDDHSGCSHRFLVGPHRIDGDREYGFCDGCKQEVALELDPKTGQRTGRSWLWEGGHSVRSE